jgi:hypothetical protein
VHEANVEAQNFTKQKNIWDAGIMPSHIEPGKCNSVPYLLEHQQEASLQKLVYETGVKLSYTFIN